MVDPRYLLDSNIAILLLKAQAQRAAARLAEESPGAIVTSAICLGEMMMKMTADQQARLSRFREIVAVLPYDDAAAAAYARLPFKRHRFDRLIAAHALALDLTIVTANEKDFADVPGLRVENWTA